MNAILYRGKYHIFQLYFLSPYHRNHAENQTQPAK